MFDALIESPDRALIHVNGIEYLNFSGFCYLGLNGRHEIAEAMSQGIEQYGFSNDLGYGIKCPVLRLVETAVSEFVGTEDAVLFATGYLFYPIAVEAFSDRIGHAFLPIGTHYSAEFGLRAAQIPCSYFDPATTDYALMQLISDTPFTGAPAILTDGVAPTTGRISPLDVYSRCLRPKNGVLIVDDAHGFGTVGPSGRGSPALFRGLENLVWGATFSKSLSLQGGVVFGDRTLTEKIKSTSKIYGGTTLPTVPVAMAVISALNLLQEDLKILGNLKRNSRLLKSGLSRIGIEVDQSESPIAAFSFGNREKNAALIRHLKDRSIIAILSNYAGAPDEGCIRLSVYSDHSPNQINYLVQAILDFMSHAK